MISWVYKLKYAIIRTIRKQWKSILTCSFSSIGFAFAIAEFLYGVFESNYGFNFIRDNFLLLIIICFLLAVIINWKPLHYTCFLENQDIKITLVVDDIFSRRGALVIPTNTTFDTLMDDEFISVKSVQGQFQEKFYKNNIQTLNREVSNGLKGIVSTTVKDGRTTNKKRYAIGTTCKLSIDNQHAYFLAIADINKYGKPENTAVEHITISLVSLWQRLNEIGHLEPILMPIIGTGRAGIKDAPRDKIIREIIFSFIVAAREMKVTENLVICIHPLDYADKNLHWDDLCEYLKYTCKYQYCENHIREGKPETEVSMLSKSNV